eukprot:2263238-Rhodomonas_salina.4
MMMMMMMMMVEMMLPSSTARCLLAGFPDGCARAWGRGDPWGHVDEGEFEPGGWMYYLNTEGKWDAVPQVTE